ncbi:MAG TPA: efflux RND transporter periplasmic adaptor subunit [Bradyrhizobium sp.]|uniref:efflux RND transporter periplasmic adaptor subunit n=1 Tax=Bradyrhizobium sp. TaxID=376 RepID=UPI002B9F4019|nr:efflux RND transporter periplasmic adaptor subunit [Bradyrhizobium sp.]HLZ03108.1 efflux RND transporter periplasmic adaptor subunit [Bradyrhizobium sp.]
MLLLGAVVMVWRLSAAAHAPPAAAPTALPGVPVTAGSVAAADVPIVLRGLGTVQAYNTVAVKSRVDGHIVSVDFKEGQEVKEGAVLFQIDPRPYQAALDQATANIEKDHATLANAQLNFNRDAKLIESHLAISQQQYDTDKATVAADQAALDSDKAQAEVARLNLSYCTITAPIDGRLGARLIDKGNLVQSTGNATLVNITQIKPIFVSFTLPQNTLDELRRQQDRRPLAVDAVAGDNETTLAEGKLTLVDNMVDPSTGTIHLKAQFDNQDERLWPGEFVNVRVVLSVRQQVPTVPQQTVLEGADGHFVYVIKPDDTVERRAVEVAAVQDGKAVITKGLKPGEPVVVEGQYRLNNGARIRSQARPQSGGERPNGAPQ